MRVKTREQFYHPVTGRLPKQRARKGEPFDWPDHLGVEALPMDAVIIEGTDEQKAALKEAQAARLAQIKQTKADGKNSKQLESMQAFQVAMQTMMGAVQQKTVVATVADDDVADDEDEAPASRRRRRSA